MQQPPQQKILRILTFIFVFAGSAALLLGALNNGSQVSLINWKFAEEEQPIEEKPTPTLELLPNGRPQLSPLPAAKEVWQCEVIVVGGSLGGVAAASVAMKSKAKTCLIELTPWLGGQLSSQGVSALDESVTMMTKNNFSQNWQDFKRLIRKQPVKLPAWAKQTKKLSVDDINSCWVGRLCFPPKVGAMAAEQLLESAVKFAGGSRWETSTAFKGAEFDSTGRFITAIYAVQRIPRSPDYVPKGRPSQELDDWYSWSSNPEFEKVPLRLEAPPGKRLIVIDATDTGELMAWARVPYRLGSEAKAITGEKHAPAKSNPECTQAFTFPFVLAIKNDNKASLKTLNQIKPEYSRREHHREFYLKGYSMFEGRSFFKYRRIVSLGNDGRFDGTPVPGDMAMVNWVFGNNWNWMNPPLLLTEERLTQTGQYQNWMGGLSLSALRHAEERALLFSEWVMETQSNPKFPLAHLSGSDSPMATVSGLSMMPYIREGRRILGRSAYGQTEFMIREPDVRNDMQGGRKFNSTAVAVTHYDVDIQGCMYRNWHNPWEAVSAGVQEDFVHPIYIPLEALIPQGVDNLLIGGKGIAVSHIVNAATRLHYGEWTFGAAAGATAGWLIKQPQSNLTPAQIVPKKLMPKLHQHLKKLGLRFTWE
ncbi:MAG TPA: NAD(FAD)-dependent dehydrogenase [Cyanobacteria bacterium UBA11369]|nr:NAD(FAD)-dependent dehydrogenase [Cyanobacteria bacterium UBA11371]HBE34461.1 NAD(FAD)-dependent dehydrogenase [Cyanobacteria bacterium UBA11368]HBE52661.1 NAD(FAD)-dependent dehydrogenase [Cyanobacteria bacterium UBA11369]